MDTVKAEQIDGNVVLRDISHFDLDEILDCGQCFRWNRIGEKRYAGVAWGKALELGQEGKTLTLYQTTLEEFEETWYPYFDFDRDYGAVKELLRTDGPMARAVDFCPGMRVVRQEPWEALVSFIISQNNNIPRIKGIVERLCAAFGEALPGGAHAFPTPERLAGITLEDIGVIRSGFRGKYILDAACLVSSGALELAPLYHQDLDEARAQLMRIKGVGPKVAECALLYGFGRGECMPEDVWIKRALVQLYPQGFPERLACVAGIGQQYLFHYMRKSGDAPSAGECTNCGDNCKKKKKKSEASV